MNRRIHMIFCGIYCILALAGCLWDFGLLPGSGGFAFLLLGGIACAVGAILYGLGKKKKRGDTVSPFLLKSQRIICVYVSFLTADPQTAPLWFLL